MQMRLRIVVAALTLGLLLTAPARAEVVNKVVGIVGDEVITAMDVDKVIKTMGVKPRADVPQEVWQARMKELRRAALERLIEDKLFQQEVERQGIRATDAEIKSFVERIKQDNAVSDQQFASQLSRRGITPEDYQEQLRKDILKHKLITREVKGAVVISEDQVEQYYKDHLDQYQNQARIKLRALFLTLPDDATPAAQEAKRKLAEKLRAEAEEKKNMAELAGKYSEGPGASSGGELGPMTTQDLLPAMRQAVAELQPGQLSKVLVIPSGYVFIQLLDREGTSTVPLDEVKGQIRKTLEQAALEKKYQEWLKTLKERTFIRIIE